MKTPKKHKQVVNERKQFYIQKINQLFERVEEEDVEYVYKYLKKAATATYKNRKKFCNEEND